MASLIIISFIVVFALFAGLVTMGLKLLEAQRKKQVSMMLQTVTGETSVLETQLLKDGEDGEGLGLTKFLKEIDILQKIDTKIQQAGMDWSVNKFVQVTVGAAVVGAIVGSQLRLPIPGVFGALGLGLLFALLPYLLIKRKRTKRLAAFEAQLPEALDFLSRAMRAGHAFSVSLEMLADESEDPLAVEFRRLFNEQNLGSPIDVALRNLATRVPSLDVGFFVSAVLLQKETGGNLSEILTKLSYVIRERFQLKGQVKAASAHGRMTATILTAMPLVLTGALMVIAPEYLTGMAKDSDGGKIIGGAVVAQMLGYYFIRKIINIKV
jgi:tight adherence protein B